LPQIERPLRILAWPLVSAVLMFVLAWVGIEGASLGGRVAVLWLANAAIIALLLRRPRSTWLLLGTAALLGNVAAALLTGDTLPLALALSACNLVEILLVAHLLERRFPQAGSMVTLPAILVLALTGLGGALLSSALAFVSVSLLGEAISLEAVAPWLLADLNGLLILTPLFLSLSEPRERDETRGGVEFALLAALALGVCLTIFAFRASSMFFMAPVLVLAALRLEVRKAALLVGAVCITACLMTAGGLGPLNTPHVDYTTRVFLLQGFMAAAVLLTLPVAALSKERQRTADELRRREEHYRLLADNSSDMVLRLDGQGHAGFVSDAALRLLGVEPAAIAGPRLLERLHPDDRLRMSAALQRTLRQGEAVSCFRMQHSTGPWRWVEAHIRRADHGQAGVGPADHHGCDAALDGRCTTGASAPCPQAARLDTERALRSADDVALVATVRDIHQRRSAELLAADSAARLRESNRLLLVAEGLASLGHWFFEPEQGEVRFSAEAAALLGLDTPTLAPRDALEVIAAADRRPLLRKLVEANRAESPAECVVRYLTAGGERTLQLRIQRNGSGPGRVGLIGVISDITDKLAAERQLVEALEEAQTAAAARSQFLATMSHEIRTPMTGVLGMIELLNDDPALEERQLFLDTLGQSADLLMSVLNDILDFSKIDSGQFAFADEPFDLGGTLAATLQLFDRAASARQLNLRFEGPEPGETWLRGDAQRLQQVLSNLLSNAIKFSERSEVTVRCSVRPRPGAHAAVRLTVGDKGLGISPAAQAQLFEPFIQGEGASGRGGTGLGLAISRRLVAGMGGNIAVRSALGRGSAFTVSLTLPQAAPLPRARKRFVARAARPLDLLLAEDNPVNQLLVTALLNRMGHRVTCATDGQSAIELSAQRRFDLILMDMQMPRCDGLGATSRIRRGGGPNAETPVIALTADASAERRAVYTARGIDALLTKPIDCAALAATLARFAARPELQDDEPPPRDATEVLDLAILDEVRALLGRERLADLLGLLATEIEQRPRAIRQALADREFERAAAEAHSLKGAASNLGALQVADAALGIEQVIKTADRMNHVDLGPALRQLAAAVARTQDALAAQFHPVPEPIVARA